jgi:Fic family protein
MSEILYQINPDRNIPWNALPLLPINEVLYRTTEIYEKLGEAKAALARLQGRSVVIPNQGLLINSISLQEAKASSAIENIFTTDDELYRAIKNIKHWIKEDWPRKHIRNHLRNSPLLRRFH